jgi:5-methylcytosine-specific restriction endonuclease McrA
MTEEEQIKINRNKVWGMFHSRCIRCDHPATEIHEIIPRSKRPNDWWEIENMVCLCMKCHQWGHNRGTKFSAPILTVLRKERLEYYATSSD